MPHQHALPVQRHPRRRQRRGRLRRPAQARRVRPDCGHRRRRATDLPLGGRRPVHATGRVRPLGTIGLGGHGPSRASPWHRCQRGLYWPRRREPGALRLHHRGQVQLRGQGKRCRVGLQEAEGDRRARNPPGSARGPRLFREARRRGCAVLSRGSHAAARRRRLRHPYRHARMGTRVSALRETASGRGGPGVPSPDGVEEVRDRPGPLPQLQRRLPQSLPDTVRAGRRRGRRRVAVRRHQRPRHQLRNSRRRR